MKKTINILLAVTLIGIALSSCQKSAVEPLSGKYAPAQKLSGVEIINGGVSDADGYSIFSVTSQGINLQFTGTGWFLAPGNYAVAAQPGDMDVLLAGSTINGKTLESGAVSVTKDGDSYGISGTLWLTDGSVYKIDAAGTLHYEEVVVVPNYYFTLADYTNDEGVKRGYNLTLANLDGSPAGNLLIITNGKIAQSYEIVGDVTTADNGLASVGMDLSAFFGLPAGSFVAGSYFYEDGKMYILYGGTIKITGDESIAFDIEISNIVATGVDGSAYSGSSIRFETVAEQPPIPVPDPVTLTLEGWSAEYSFKDNAEAGTRDHTLSLKDASGSDAGQILVTTTVLDGINGSFEVATDTDKIGRYTAGADLSIFGLGMIGSYVTVFGANYAISGGTMAISSDSETISVSVTDLPGIEGINGLSLPAMALTIAQPEDPQPPVVPGEETFTLEGCTYTLVTIPKEGMEGVSEHTFVFKDASDNVVASYVEWTAADAAITGSFTYSAATATAIGSYAGGMDFFGIALLGTYYVRDGASYLVNAGTAEVTEAGGKLSIKITGLASATTAGDAGTATILEIKDAVNADVPVEKETFLVENGTYTLISLPKEGVDGVTEHTFTFMDAEGNTVGSYVEWTATDAAYTGFFTYADPTATAIGSYAGGLDFFGIMTLGTYYVRDGVDYLVNAGNAIVAEEDGKLSVMITDLGSAAKDGTAGTAEILYFQNFTKAE